MDAPRIARFRELGFTHFERLVDDKTLGTLREGYDTLLAGGATDPRSDDRHLGGLTRQFMRPEFSLPCFEHNAAVAAGIDIARRLMGWEDPVRTFSMLIFKPAGHPHETPWHQDASYAGLPVTPAGRPTGMNTLQFWLAIDDADVENGCMHFHPNPGTATLPHYVASGDPGDDGRLLAIEDAERYVDPARVTPVPLRAGGASVHHEGTLHYTPANTSNRPRRAYIFNIADREFVKRAFGRSARQDANRDT
ncbi:MAG: phytanoyl-CoA dioxygenase family protein [Pseudomonadales bacterium]|nr:phytanoyl-CoA dioxygenase family protein [Pseudomonadales bacterium]